MRKNILLLALFACGCALWAAPAPSRPVGSAPIKRGFTALKSGNITDPIWTQTLADGTTPPRVDRKLRPGEGDDVSIGGPDTTITIAVPISVNFYQHRGNRVRTAIKEGGALKTNGTTGLRGVKPMVGTYSMTGGSMEVENIFYLAGCGPMEDPTCTFEQSGGTLTLVNTALNITGPFPLTCSPNAVGVYNFSGGTINLLCDIPNPERVGVRKGVGKGTFNWTGGVLNAKHLSEGITNAGGRLSPGGEGVVGETTLVSDIPQTYIQQPNGILSIDIAGRNRFDRLVWKDKTNNSTVRLEDGTTIAVNYLKDYKPSGNLSFQIVQANRIAGGDRLRLEGNAAKDFSYEIIPDGPNAGLRLVYTPGKGGHRVQSN